MMADAAEPAALGLENISKSYGAGAVLANVSLSIRRGEFVALVGPSGCGKSTLLRIAAGLEDHEAGRVVLNGKDVTGARAAERDVAMVFQSYALYPHLTARQNIALPLLMRRLNARERWPFVGPLMSRSKRATIFKDVDEIAESLQIAHLMARKPSQLSGGQRQRVALGRAIVRRPQAFLMDEPLSNLDAALRVSVRNEIVGLHRKAGVVTLYVTHDQEEALSMADRVAVMLGGRILQVGTPAEVYQQPAHLDVAKFIGVPQINLVDAIIENGTAKALGAELAHAAAASEGSAVTVGFRPEDIALTTERATSAVAVRLERIEFLGAGALVHLSGTDGSLALVARMQPAEANAIASQHALFARVDPMATLVFDASGARLARAAGSRRGFSDAA
jgi:multiple sugar transport system ATP-binding protein